MFPGLSPSASVTRCAKTFASRNVNSLTPGLRWTKLAHSKRRFKGGVLVLRTARSGVHSVSQLTTTSVARGCKLEPLNHSSMSNLQSTFCLTRRSSCRVVERKLPAQHSTVDDGLPWSRTMHRIYITTTSKSEIQPRCLVKEGRRVSLTLLQSSESHDSAISSHVWHRA